MTKDKIPDGLKKMRLITGKEPTYQCNNCNCKRYSKCNCMRKNK